MRRIYAIMGRPYSRDFKNMIRSHVIKNVSLTLEDVDFTNIIFGPNLGLLKRKPARTTTSLVVQDYAAIPASIC